jgi:hypothetical protein
MKTPGQAAYQDTCVRRTTARLYVKASQNVIPVLLLRHVGSKQKPTVR